MIVVIAAAVGVSFYLIAMYACLVVASQIFIPKSVAEMLEKIKADQDEMKSLLGKDYHKYDQVMATDYGLPLYT